MITAPTIGQKVKLGHCSVQPKEFDAEIIAIHSPTKVRLRNAIGEDDANWFNVHDVNHSILPYGEVWCYPAEDKEECARICAAREMEFAHILP